MNRSYFAPIIKVEMQGQNDNAPCTLYGLQTANSNNNDTTVIRCTSAELHLRCPSQVIGQRVYMLITVVCATHFDLLSASRARFSATNRNSTDNNVNKITYLGPLKQTDYIIYATVRTS